MPVLGQRFRELDADSVNFEVIAVRVRCEQFVGEVRDRLTHRHQLERKNVDLAGRFCFLTRAHEVSDAQETVAMLTRVGEPEPFRCIRFSVR